MQQGIRLLSAHFDEIGRYGRGCFQTGMRHTVYHCVISLMSNSGHDRQGKLCHIGCQFVGVETVKVTYGSSSAYDNNSVPLFPLRYYRIESGNNATLNKVTLHRCGKEAGSEGITRLVQLVGKVAISGSRLA